MGTPEGSAPRMIQFVIQHPVAVLICAGIMATGWFISGCISVMPPLPPTAGWWLTFAWRCAQVLGAGFDKVGHAAQQTTAYKQFEQTLKTSDSSGLSKTETAITTTATPVPDPKA
jgi:hypothetical protein